MKKALVMLLALAMLVPMVLVMPASAEAPTPDKPFYTMGWSDFDPKSYEYLDGLYRNMMFEAEDREFLESVASGNYKGCTMADAARAIKIYCKVYGDDNPPPEGWNA